MVVVGENVEIFLILQSISPGVVETEFRIAAAKGSGLDPVEEEKKYDGLPQLKAKDLADAVLYTLSTPPHVQVHEIIIKPLGEAF